MFLVEDRNDVGGEDDARHMYDEMNVLLHTDLKYT